MTEFGIVIEVRFEEPRKPAFCGLQSAGPMVVTPAGILAFPEQDEWLTTVLLITVKVPLTEQLITWVFACAGEVLSPERTKPRIAIAESLRFIGLLTFCR